MNKTYTYEELKEYADVAWTHSRHGGAYYLHMFTNADADPDKTKKFPLTAVYMDIDKGLIWSRPFEDFLENFEKL